MVINKIEGENHSARTSAQKAKMDRVRASYKFETLARGLVAQLRQGRISPTDLEKLAATISELKTNKGPQEGLP